MALVAFEPIFVTGEPVAYRTYVQLRADALVAVASADLDEHASAGRSLPEVVVHVDADALALDTPDGRCEIHGVGGIAPETARRIACDAGIVTLLEKGGEPLDIGRRSRKIPPGLRRALLSRDRCCRFPAAVICLAPRCTTSSTRIRSGETKLPNLMLLCRFHHRLVHERGYEIRSDGAFVRLDGSVIETCATRPPTPRRDLSARHERTGVMPVRQPNAPIGAGERLNLEYVTWVFFFQHERDDRGPPKQG